MELRLLPAAILVLGCALGASGCGGYGSLCQDTMDCIGGNDNDEAACEVKAQALEDEANVTDCNNEYDDYLACFEDHAACHDNRFDDRGYCHDEYDRLSRCVGDGSNVGGGL